MNEPIENVITGMMEQIKGYGLREETINYYKSVCCIIIRYFEEKEGGIYSENSLQKFKSITDQRCANGEICSEYCRFINRVSRMLSSYAATRQTDFTSKIIPKKYLPTIKNQELICSMLDKNKLKNEARYEIDIVMRHFFCYIENANITVGNITDNHFFEFMQTVSESNKGSRGRTWRALRLISEYLKSHHLANLTANLSMIKMKEAPIKMIAPYSQEEIHLLIGAINLSSMIGIRDNAIVLLAFETGLRAVDIINLEYSDIDWKKGILSIKQRKTNSCVTLPLNGTVMNALADYILIARPEHDSPKIFLTSKEPVHPFLSTASLGAIVDKYCAKASVEKKPQRRFHSLRRSFATELSMEGVPLSIISQMLGHKNIDADRPYLTYDKTHVSFCALDFTEIPISGGIYSNISSCNTSSTGGDEV